MEETLTWEGKKRTGFSSSGSVSRLYARKRQNLKRKRARLEKLKAWDKQYLKWPSISAIYSRKRNYAKRKVRK